MFQSINQSINLCGHFSVLKVTLLFFKNLFAM